ncbi:MAG: hypothetical protein MJ185_11985 [Treponema sp.]|nr:hypothetical protein [Treponema sp.]
MKKIVKLFGIMTIAAALLVSCKPAEDPVDNSTASDTGTTTEQTGGTNTGSEEGTADETPKAFSYSVDLTKAKVSDAYCGTYAGSPIVSDKNKTIIDVAEDGAFIFMGGYWDSFKIAFDDVDLSSAKKVTITAKTGADYTAPDAIIFEYASGDKAVGASTWTDPSFLKLTAEYADYSLSLDKFSDLSGDKNSKYTGGKLEDRKAVNSVTFNPRGAEGQIYIKSIVFSE